MILATHIIGGKWKLLLISIIGRKDKIRFGQILAYLPEISRKVLTQKLKELEKDGLVDRVSFNETPPRVEYSLTQKGKSLLTALAPLEQWSTKNYPELLSQHTEDERSP